MKIELKIPTMEDKDGLKAVCNATGNTCLTDCHTHTQMNPLNGGFIWLQKTTGKPASGV